MGSMEMDTLRQNLRLEHEGAVRVTFVYPYRLPVFECVSCMEPMLWAADKDWWSCPDCGYELTSREAAIIAEHLFDGTQKFKQSMARKTNRGFWTWLSETLFARQKHLPHS